LIAELVLLAADKTIETGVINVFRRHQAVGSREFSFKSFVHVARDPGCYRRAPEFLSPLADQYEHALVIFDREGSGATMDRSAIEDDVEKRLSTSGWNSRSACVVVDPEIENWVWSDSPQVPACLGWSLEINLRSWMTENGLWPAGVDKPPRPKEALESVMRLAGKPRSSSVYGAVAAKVSLARCADPAFRKMREVLQAWFPSA
jgi:hypothetical protein